ncbi:MAG: EamA family transporter [Cyclobacteriaceae bacterium]
MYKEGSSTLSAYLQLHFIVLLWGFTAILGKLISLPSLEIVFFRTLFAFIALYFIVRLRRQSLKLGNKGLLTILGTGTIIALHWTLFFLAAKLSNVSICLAGMATTSLWTSVLDPLITKRKVKYYEPILAVIAIVGISIVFDAVIDHYVGFLVAVFSAMLASLFTVLNGKLVKHKDYFVISFLQMLGACLSVLVFMLIYNIGIEGSGINFTLSMSDLIWLLILSMVCTVYAYSISIKLMHRISAFALNLTVNLEPVYGILLAVFIFGSSEKMYASFYWGTSLVLVSVLLYPAFSYYSKKGKPGPPIT